MQEMPAGPGEARACWEAAARAGAVGAVTSWGAGIPGRAFLRIYWEVAPDAPAPPEGEDLEEENWTPYWRGVLEPVAVSARVWLVPAWANPPPEARGTVLWIDPGMAFGAGDHPTTRLCLRVVEAMAAGAGVPTPVLDVGTGTGVLALAAAALGAGRVDALDIDPFGFAACRRNARRNRLEGRVRPLLLSLDLVDGAYPLILANVVAGQLETLAGHLRRLLRPGGRLVVSGFQADEERRVVEALGLAVEERAVEDGWPALTLAKEAR
ncbi:MAG: methyltransferase domain-containing protein [Deltaproteobacteria bacterium]|nr:methyltransferase domain-containing protein [Deltaproteobacteria bacterium]